jgi:hypothetical protein
MTASTVCVTNLTPGSDATTLRAGPGGVAGWLCSAGVVRASRDDAVEIVFDSFWTAEEGGAPRDNPVAKDVAKGGDRIVNSIGTAVHSRGVHGPFRLSSIEPCFGCHSRVSV